MVESILNRRDIGYTIISRFEECLRAYIADEISNHFAKFEEAVPIGIMNKSVERSDSEYWDDVSEFLDHTDFPDLAEICCYGNNYTIFFPESNGTRNEFTLTMAELYTLRNKIAHVKQHFNAFDLDKLIDGTTRVSKSLDIFGTDFLDFISVLQSDPSKVLVRMPVGFSSDYVEFEGVPNNLPTPDYEHEGGFVGRKDDIQKITSLLLGPRNVITISGAGGVGKTALALRVVNQILERPKQAFDAVVWMSAKETKLSYLGIENIEPTLKNYEELLDTIFYVTGFENPKQTIVEKEDDVATIFELFTRTLIVVDNLETITDDRITEFILDVEDKFPSAKILITSRRGLGQVERRYELAQLKRNEAVNLFRRVARDKGLHSLLRISDSVLEEYVMKIACYPLAIKWVIGQVAVGRDINVVISEIDETTSDISKFSFEQVYQSLSEIARRTLCALSIFDDSPSAGVLSYVIDSTKEDFEDALRELVLVSLVIPEQYINEQNEIGNRYVLLSLTRGYVRQQLDIEPHLKRVFSERLASVQSTIEEATRAEKQYRFSLANLGAITEEEQVAAMLAQTAFQKYQAGRYSDAVRDYKRAIQIAPRFASLYRNWAVMESSEQHPLEADQLLDKAAELNPSDVQIWLTWGNIKRKESKIKDALDKYEIAFKLSPDDPIVLNALGQARMRNGDHEKADFLFRQAIDITGTGSTTQNEIVNHSSISGNLMRWAEVDRRNHNYESAKQKLSDALERSRIALQLNEGDFRTQQLLRKNLLELGFVMQRSDRNAALEHFKEAIVDKPFKMMKHSEVKDTLIASLQAGRILRDLGRIEEAKQVFPQNLRTSIYLQNQNRRLRDSVQELWNSLYDHANLARQRGQIKWFSHVKAYGFIINQQGDDIFVHISSIRSRMNSDAILPGSWVEYSVGKPKGQGRVQAVDVELIRERT